MSLHFEVSLLHISNPAGFTDTRILNEKGNRHIQSHHTYNFNIPNLKAHNATMTYHAYLRLGTR